VYGSNLIATLNPTTDLGDTVFASGVSGSNSRLAIGMSDTVLTVNSLGVPSWTYPGLLFAPREQLAVIPSGVGGVADLSVAVACKWYYTQPATSNFVVNVTGNIGDATSLNSVLSTSQTITVVLLCANGGVHYLATSFTIDGVYHDVEWAGGVQWDPPEGTASSTDRYTYVIVKIADSTYSVFGDVTTFVA
jgi:hypothetical protein